MNEGNEFLKGRMGFIAEAQDGTLVEIDVGRANVSSSEEKNGRLWKSIARGLSVEIIPLPHMLVIRWKIATRSSKHSFPISVAVEKGKAKQVLFSTHDEGLFIKVVRDKQDIVQRRNRKMARQSMSCSIVGADRYPVFAECSVMLDE